MAADAKLIQEITEFRQSFKSLILATAADDQPGASYAPYIEDNKPNFYIFISRLAKHTANILANPQADLLWIENEDGPKNIFARKRLQINCKANIIEKSDHKHEAILQRMRAELGDTIKVLKSLPDFLLVELVPQRATYVQGFAQAFNLTASDLKSNKA